MSLGVDVDIVKSAVENASLVISQVNSFMPRTHGDGFIHIDKVDFLVPHDEPILEHQFSEDIHSEVTQEIGNYVSRLVQDGDTIQIGYGKIPDALTINFAGKKHLGVHTELIGDGIVELMKMGVIDNTRKTIDQGKTIASFCMGNRKPTTISMITHQLSLKRLITPIIPWLLPNMIHWWLSIPPCR
jgi:acyl-CoA hydrolase